MSKPHSIRFWKIEQATGGGYYIVHDGTYTTPEGAVSAFPKDGGNYRVQEYQQGRGTDGPERVEP